MTGTVQGSNGSDLINDAYLGDPEGDQIDNNDAPSTGGNEDIVVAGDGDDIVDAGLANDTIYGGDGDDTLHGGEGADSVYGGEGSDTILLLDGFSSDILQGGETGSDNDTVDLSALTNSATVSITASGDTALIDSGSSLATATEIETFVLSDNDDNFLASGSVAGFTVHAGAGADTITGGTLADTFYGGDGNDLVFGGGGDDLVYGGAGDDTLIANEGNDSFVGGAGDDIFLVGEGNDTLEGGEGDDTFILETGSGTNTIYGGETGTDNDIIITNQATNAVFSSDEAGTIALSGSPDISIFMGVEGLFLSDEDDVIDNSASSAGLYASLNDGDDTFLGGNGSDTVFGGLGDDSIAGGDGDDTLHGDAGEDELFGGDGEDLLTTGEGADSAFGGAGDDTIVVSEGLGGNSIHGGVGADNFDLNSLTAGVNVFFSGDETGSVNNALGFAANFTEIEELTLTDFNDFVNATAAVTDQTFSGNGGDDIIVAGSGNDSISGGAGADTLVGGDGNDEIRGDRGNDVLGGQLGDDTLFGGDGSDVFFTEDGFGHDTLYGGEDGDDVDVFDATSLSTGVTLSFSGDESGSFTDGVSNGTFEEIEAFHLSGFDDTITTDTGTDTIFAGSGSDTLIVGVGAGDHTFDAGEDGTETDVIDASSLTAGVSVSFTSSETGTLGSDTGLVYFSGVEEFILSDATDIVNGTASTDAMTIDAAGGNDIVSGGSGDDVIFGGSGGDILIGGEGTDTIYGGDGADSLTGEGGSDVLYGGDRNDVFEGSSGDDVLYGGSGTDSVDYSVSDVEHLVVNTTVDSYGDGISLLSDGSSQTTTSVENYTASDSNGEDDAIVVTDDVSFSDISNFDDTATGVFTATDGTVTAFGPSETVQFSDVISGEIPGTFNITSGDRSGSVRDISFNGYESVSFSVVCFTRGTRIQTAQGERRIQDICVGDLVKTLDDGFRPVRWIGSKVLSQFELKIRPRLKPITIKAGALGKNKPLSELQVSPQHRILIKSKIARNLFDEHEILVPAVKLLGYEGIDRDDQCLEVEYYHMMFDKHQVVWAEGALCESLYVGPEAVKSLSPESVREIKTLFPELFKGNGKMKKARHVVEKKNDVRKLILRHQKHTRPLYVDRVM